MREDQPRSTNASDTAALIVAIAERADRDSFVVLFTRFAPKVKRYLQRLGCAEPVSEEIAQECLLTVWRKAVQFDPSRASAEAWVYAIVRNLYIDLVRRERRPEDLLCAEALYEQATPEQTLKAAEGEHLVRTAIAALPRNQEEVMRLAFFEGCTHNQIAEMLRLPLGTVKSRIRLATAQLRSALESLA